MESDYPPQRTSQRFTQHAEAALSRMLRVAPMFPGKMTLAKMVERMAPYKVLELVRISNIVQFRMNLHPANSVDFSIRYNGIWEPELTRVVTRILHKGSIAVDAGANIGYYTCLFSHLVGLTGQVHSFEPVPWTFRELSENVALNSLRNVVLNNSALLNEKTQVTMYLYPGPDPGQDSIGRFPGASTGRLPSQCHDLGRLL